MGFTEVYNNIRTKFEVLANASSQFNLVDVAWDNVVLEGPVTPNANVWLRFQILTGESLPRWLSDDGSNTTGVVLVSVFTTVGIGDSLALAVADEIVDDFVADPHTAAGALVTFRTPSVKHIGLREPWWQTNVTIPFFTEDT